MDKKALIQLATHNQQIWDQGSYALPGGNRVPLETALQDAIHRSVLIQPDGHAFWAAAATKAPRHHRGHVEVVNETTFAGALRLRALGHTRILALNFASAVSPGGGYLSGATAQEEDLCRCSTLYPSLVQHMDYYEMNRRSDLILYTDAMILSEAITVFRDEKDKQLLAAPWHLDILTAPAPNLRSVTPETAPSAASVRDTFSRRISQILNIAAAKGYTALVLGAWGCGAFRNDPVSVADCFAEALRDSRWKGVFDKIVFSVLDREEKLGNYRAFRQALLPYA